MSSPGDLFEAIQTPCGGDLGVSFSASCGQEDGGGQQHHTEEIWLHKDCLDVGFGPDEEDVGSQSTNWHLEHRRMQANDSERGHDKAAAVKHTLCVVGIDVMTV